MSTKSFLIVRDGAGDEALRGAVVAIGNFDGVHRGHRAVIDAALARARDLRRPAAALTFEPHPRDFFPSQENVFRLTDEASKLALLGQTGLDGAIVLTFDAALARLSAEQFVQRILVERFAISGAVIGFNFHFGVSRTGSPAFLATEGRKCGFSVDIVPPFADNGRPIASGPIRDLLAAGRVEQAAEFLGYCWFVSAPVIHGDKRGRELGFPTANLRLDPTCALRHGIYAVRVAVRGQLYGGVASFGRRPMFDTAGVLLEVFLFDFSGDLYGASIEVAFVSYLREEERFASLEALVAQMHEDARRARAALARAGNGVPPV